MELIAALCDGLALDPRPYQRLAERTGLTEAEVIARIQAMRDDGVIRRFGVVVRHHDLGYRCNAMVVWDIPDDVVSGIGQRLGALDEVTLCYRRPRRLPDWPYNLFTMIHGRERAEGEAIIARLAEREGLNAYPHEILFSLKRFKQCGARYGG